MDTLSHSKFARVHEATEQSVPRPDIIEFSATKNQTAGGKSAGYVRQLAAKRVAANDRG